MTEKTFYRAIEDAVVAAMARDDRILVMGEDVRLFHSAIHARFGNQRVLDAPISEAGFLGAGVGAAMAGLRPIVHVMLVDFIGVAMDVVLNHMAKVEAFSGGRMRCPIVVRAACGGGYGDAGQHQQALWGLLASIPGISIVVPSTPGDAAALMGAAIASDGPVFFLEHKLLSELWLDSMGSGGRRTVTFDVPRHGRIGPVDPEASVPIGQAAVVEHGSDVTLASVAVGVHRCLEAAARLAGEGIDAEVIDLRTVRPLDRETLVESVGRTGRLVVVDEDYEQFGLSGELAAVCLEAGLAVPYGRVCTRGTIPYARDLEERALPNVERIVTTVCDLCDHPASAATSPGSPDGRSPVERRPRR